MFRLLILCMVVVVIGAIVAPSFRVALGWVLAFLSLLLLGDLILSSVARRRRKRGTMASPRA